MTWIEPSCKRAPDTNPKVVVLIKRFLEVDEDELVTALEDAIKMGWQYPKSDLMFWIPVLNRFDGSLKATIKEYDLCEPRSKKEMAFAPMTKRMTLAIFGFIKLLIENCTNINIFSSYDRLNDFLLTTDMDVLLGNLRLILRSVQHQNLNDGFGISPSRLLDLLQRWSSNGGTKTADITLVDVQQSLRNSPDIRRMAVIGLLSLAIYTHTTDETKAGSPQLFIDKAGPISQLSKFVSLEIGGDGLGSDIQDSLKVFVNRIKTEVDKAIVEHSVDTTLSVISSELPMGMLSHSSGDLLKALFCFIERLLTGTETLESVHNLTETQLPLSIKLIIQNKGIFGYQIYSLAINMMSTLIHSEPTSLDILQEAGLPAALYAAIDSGIEPAFDVIAAISSALVALCLNEVGVKQLNECQAIPAVFSVFTSERHVRILRDRDHASVVGSKISMLIRHQPSLQKTVLDATLAFVNEIEQIGKAVDVMASQIANVQLKYPPPETSQTITETTAPSVPLTNTQDVVMNESLAVLELVANLFQSASTSAGKKKKDDKDQDPNNPVLLIIDVACRLLDSKSSTEALLMTLADLPDSPLPKSSETAYASPPSDCSIQNAKVLRSITQACNPFCGSCTTSIAEASPEDAHVAEPQRNIPRSSPAHDDGCAKPKTPATEPPYQSNKTSLLDDMRTQMKTALSFDCNDQPMTSRLPELSSPLTELSSPLTELSDIASSDSEPSLILANKSHLPGYIDWSSDDEASDASSSNECSPQQQSSKQFSKFPLDKLIGKKHSIRNASSKPSGSTLEASENASSKSISSTMKPKRVRSLKRRMLQVQRANRKKKKLYHRRTGRILKASVTNCLNGKSNLIWKCKPQRFHFFPEIIHELKEKKLARSKAKKDKQLPSKSPPIQKRAPTEEEIARVFRYIKNRKYFKLFQTGHITVINNPINDIIADINFTTFKQMTAAEMIDLKFLCSWLHRAKVFVHQVSSKGRSIAGKMYAWGWRKSMTGREIFGIYVNSAANKKHPEEYSLVMSESQRAIQILWNLFFKVNNIAVAKNERFMKELNIPSIKELVFSDQNDNINSFSSNITFTTHGFFNHPHRDVFDEAQLPYAFLLCIPIRKSNGELAFESEGYDVTDGQFVFPDCGFGLNFRPDTICQMAFAQRSYVHGTLRPNEGGPFTKLGISMQISAKTTNIVKRINKGEFENEKDMHIGDFTFHSKNL